ncbi:MAG: hypothetical protein ABJP02_10380 [Parasphingorhabdus sp.]|uniref:hypothetical protein n=1 Tax=Parasphingorhabdus sp. TaxID=2709688 RepID=UPI00328EAC91
MTGLNGFLGKDYLLNIGKADLGRCSEDIAQQPGNEAKLERWLSNSKEQKLEKIQ